VSGVNNGDFVGTISGFAATYVSSNNITLSLTVGSSIYTASLSNTAPVSATTLRFTSTAGGYFDVQIAAGGQAVANQTEATTFANRLNTAFSTLTFSNDRPVTNFLATGGFIGGSARLQLSNFSDVRLDSITVTAPNSVNGTIDISINGETYRASNGLGGKIGAYETVQFVNTTNSNKILTLVNGSTAQDFSNTTTAAAFQTSLRTAFGLAASGSGVNFQIGTDTTDVLNVVVNDARIDRLFNGVTPNVSSQTAAAAAQTAIATAKSNVLSNISKVGALIERLDYAGNIVDTISQGVIQANSNLVDTDIAAESTSYAEATLKVNSAVAVIAQARNLQSGLLGLLRFGIGNA
jgi:flagellin-like hook-associated protein FlgL